MADGTCRIRREHLPDDFFDELAEAAGPAAPAVAAARPEPADLPPADLDALTLQAVRSRLASWRTFPGQGCRWNSAITSGSIFGLRFVPAVSCSNW
ncbi:MAG TPA: hypothetical protein VN279_05470, partial [Rhodocyclaceae bacterium]|nr:hypothetical protein [Rhodocyclaceae bacterium]